MAYAFSVGLSIGGSALSDAALKQIAFLEYVESIDELDALVVQLQVPAGGDPDEILDLVEAGKKYALTLETEDGTLEAAGDILEAGIRYDAAGGWAVTLRGLEGLHRLRGAQTPKLWTGSPSSFLSTIAQRHGLTCTAEGLDGNAAYMLQADEDDALFAKRIARDANYYLRVEDGKLLFGRRHVAKGTKVSVNISRIRSLSVESSLADIVSKVTVVCEDYTEPKQVTASAESAKLKKISGGDDGPKLAKAAFGAREVVMHNSYCTVPSLASMVAVAQLQRAAETLVRGSLRTSGVPTALSGQLVEIEDVPWPATGPFLIRQTRHVVEGSSYDTEIDFLSDTLPVKS